MDKTIKPRILFIATPRAIGNEAYLAHLLPKISDRYDCTVLATPSVLKTLKGSAKAHQLKLFPKVVQKTIKRNYRLKKIYYNQYFKTYFKKNSYDIINFLEFDGAFVESINYGPKVLTEQTRLLVSEGLKDWARGCLETIDKIVCASQQPLLDVTNLGVSKDRCQVIHGSVDTSKFKPAEKPGEYIDWIGLAGAEDKKPLLFVQIAEAAQAQGLDYKFRLIGGGSAIKKMSDYAKRHGVVNITVLGPKSSDEMVAIYRQTKLLCITSMAEGLPYQVLEAMACGKPVVSTEDVEGLGEIIGSSPAGKLVSSPDEWQFLAEIKMIMDNDGLYKKMGLAARSRIVNDFSISKQVEQTTRLYASLLKK